MRAAAGLRQAIGSSRFWFILALLAFLTFLHYVEQMGVGGALLPSVHFGLTRHSLDRILFLVPIVYASYTFGLMAGLATTFVSLIAMLPRAVFISPVPQDALLETFGVMVMGALACQWLGVRDRQRDRYQKALDELQSAHEQLQRYVRIARSEQQRLATTNAISAVLTRCFELKDSLKKAADLVMEMLEIETMLVFSVEEDTHQLALLAHEGISEAYSREVSKVKVGEGFYGGVAETGETIVVEDDDNDTRIASPAEKQMRIQAQLVLPMMVGERIAGVLCVGNRRPREFAVADVDLLTAIGGQIGVAIENARLYERERSATQRCLVSETRYREVFESANDAIWIHDLQGSIMAANKATERLLGYTIEELLGMNVKSFLSQERLSQAGHIRRALMEGEPVEQPYEQHLIRRDGTEAVLKLTTNLITQDGKPRGFQHIARDVTLDREIQDNLRFRLGQIVEAQEQERKRISRELRDHAARTLDAVSRQLEGLVRQGDAIPAGLADVLPQLQAQVHQGAEAVRCCAQDLMPPGIDEMGLVPALRWLADDVQKRYSVEVEMSVLGVQRRFKAGAEVLVFRVIQEALRNAGGQAQASNMRMTVDFGEGRTRISLVDDGRGFRLSQLATGQAGALDLAGMEERVRLLGGNLSLQSQPGKGTALEIEVPL